MKRKKSSMSMFRAVAILIVVAGLGWMASLRRVQASGEPIVVIVNASNPVADLSIGELRKLFLSERSKWEPGKSVLTVMVAGGAPERTAFLKIVCGMNDADFSKYLLQAAFTGKSATPPKEASGSAAVKSTVGNSPGGIGFVRASEFPSGNPTVKAVKIDGLAPEDAGYKLKM